MSPRRGILCPTRSRRIGRISGDTRRGSGGSRSTCSRGGARGLRRRTAPCIMLSSITPKRRISKKERNGHDHPPQGEVPLAQELQVREVPAEEWPEVL